MTYLQAIELEIEQAWAHANRPERFHFTADGNTDTDGAEFDEYEASVLYSRDMRRIIDEDYEDYSNELDEYLALIDELEAGLDAAA